MPIRVLIVDDHPVFREGLAGLLGTRDRFQVVGEAKDGEEALTLAHELAPDLVVMDIRMPGVGGLEATRRIKDELPSVRIVMMTVSEDDTDLFEAVKSGAQGYILKNLGSREVLDLLERVTEGEAAFTPELASKALITLAGKDTPQQNRLSPRERQVLEQLVQGLSTARIAEELELSESTVRWHLKNILSKLHVHSRTEAAMEAVRRHIVRLPEQDGNS